ncbi:MAG: hypothetical protein H6932_11465 [Burkholderiaceae bacterium]|nr:hypothetical protein [Burkholderiaceae bacterium]
MAGAQRTDTTWRQGHVLSNEAAAALGLPLGDPAENAVVVVISHDCDIACDPAVEPEVEVIVGHRIDRLGGDANAKTARRLHLAFEDDGKEVPVELHVTRKAAVPKDAFLRHEARPDLKLSPASLLTLQTWLAARYHRAAFADEFEDRLKAKPARLDKKIAKAMDEAGEHVLAVLFAVDDGEEVKRQGPEDLYQLRIVILYDSQKNEPEAYAAAQKAADTITDAFEGALCQKGVWRDIRLESCDAVSDEGMTVAQSRLYKRWRLDHMSLEDDPQQVMLPAG